mgnify:CR=1 FL=1
MCSDTYNCTAVAEILAPEISERASFDIIDFAERAFRRPLTDDEVVLYRSFASDIAIQIVLSSTSFLSILNILVAEPEAGMKDDPSSKLFLLYFDRLL